MKQILGKLLIVGAIATLGYSLNIEGGKRNIEGCKRKGKRADCEIRKEEKIQGKDSAKKRKPKEEIAQGKDSIKKR
jgi:hypothetical protein